MSKTDFFENVRDWATRRGLYEQGNSVTQYVKLGEEFGELGKFLLRRNDAEVFDAIGDMVVVLTNLAHLYYLESVRKCKTCNGTGSYDEDVVGDGGTKMTFACDDCSELVSIEDAMENAWHEIKNRKGKMISGTFVKENGTIEHHQIKKE